MSHTVECMPRDVNTKLMSLELLFHFVRNCMIGTCDNQAPFHSSPTYMLAHAIRRLLIPCLINSTVVSTCNPRIFRYILNVIKELWKIFIFHLKVKMVVLLNHLLIRTLKIGPQTGNATKKKCVTLDHQLEALSNASMQFADLSSVLGINLIYDMYDSKAGSVINLKVWQLLCNNLCNFSKQCGAVIAEQTHYAIEN